MVVRVRVRLRITAIYRSVTKPAAPGRSSATGLLSQTAQIAFVVIAALLVYGFVGVTKEGEARRVCNAGCFLHPDYMAADRKAPGFALRNLRGESVTLDGLRGKVVLLNFWTKTCGPCLEEMPDLAELTKILRDRPDVAVVTVTPDDGPSDVQPTLQTVLREAPPFEVLFDPDSRIIGDKYGTHLFPETWFIDKRGVIRARFDGAREWNNPLVVDFIDSLRQGDYCSARIDGQAVTGSAADVCNGLTGS
jgi:peroxiredoxin